LISENFLLFINMIFFFHIYHFFSKNTHKLFSNILCSITKVVVKIMVNNIINLGISVVYITQFHKYTVNQKNTNQ